MKIGEFARVCNVPISLLRYYDSCGLLKPVYIDRFTGYRYYDEGQIAVCRRINELKEADFSLAEIKRLISGRLSSEEAERLFADKKNRLNEVLRRLDEIRKIISGGTFMETRNFDLLHEDVHIPFENDESVIGRWEILGEYDNSEADSQIGGKSREIYFLPRGEWYWCYSWTKGKLLYDDGVCSYANDYTTEKRADGLYMLVQFKSYDYLKSGKTSIIVLRQLDKRSYTANEIARKDNIAVPFENDESIIGKWKAISFVQSKEDFLSGSPACEFELYFKAIEFLPNGECVSVYGDETISGKDKQEWTRGCVLRKWNSTACAYELKSICDTEYLFIEWKSGDYRWGGFDTDYYVFIRE